MKHRFKVYVSSILLALLIVAMVATPVLAYLYQATYTIVESGGTAYPMLPVTVGAANTWMADNGFMEADALDTRVETLGGLARPHMVATNKTLTASAIPANSQTNLYFITGNTDLSSLDIITGYDGYITVKDDDTLELGNDFDIEVKGWVDTDYEASKRLVYKQDAFRTYISADETITSEITATPVTYNPDADDPEDTSVDGRVYRLSIGSTWDALQGHTDGTNVSDNGVVMETGFKSGAALWDFIYRSYLLFDTTPIPDGATITAATLQVFGTSQFDQKPWNDLTLNVYSSNPVSNIALVNADYDQVGTTAFATAITYAAFNAAGWNTFTFNAAGLAAIEVADISKFSIREATYEAPDNPPAWADTKLGQFSFQTADGANAPILTIEYTIGVTATGVSSDEITVTTSIPPALTFDGNDDYVTIGDVADLDIAGDISVEAWVNMSKLPSVAARNYRVIVKGEATGNNGWQLELNQNDRIYFRTGQVAASQATYTAADLMVIDTWYHIVATRAGVAGLIYLNGVDVTDTSEAHIDSTPAGEIAYIGAIGTDHEFEGQIGLARAYNRVLSPAEVLEHFQGYGYDETGLVGDWHMDEETGLALADSSASENDGVITDATWTTTGLLRIYIDGTLEGVAEGATVPPNANNWTINQNNVMPYMEYYEQTVGGTLVAEYNPITMIVSTDYDGTADAGGDTDTIIDAELTQADDYWIGALVTITDTGNGAPDGETSICTAFADATDEVTVSPAFTAGVDAADTYTIDFGTLTDEEVDSGTADAGTITTLDDAVLTQGDNYWNNMTLEILTTTDGLAPQGESTTVTDFDDGNDRLIFDALTVAVGAGDTYELRSDGRITWGVNPTGVAVTMGSMFAESQPTPGLIDIEPPQDVLPEVEVTDWYIEPDVSGTLLTNPLRPFVTILSDNINMSELQAWRLLATAGILLVTATTIFAVRGHLFIAGIATGATIGAAVALTIYPLWALAFIIISVGAGLAAERSPSL